MVTDQAMTEVRTARAAIEVRIEFERYEQALVDGDVDLMNAVFWASPDVVRYGIADSQVGAEALAAWRAAQPPLPTGRTLSDTIVSAVSPDVVIVSTCFTYPGRPLLGRQSQTWVRLPDGWRIVSAHVSEVPTPD
jgi:hypothetical protein